MADSANDRVWRLMKRIRICMFCRWQDGGLCARPMTALVRREEGAVYFLSSAGADREGDIERDPRVWLAFADIRHQKYVSLSGVAQIVADRRKIRELWGLGAKAWWKTPDNPRLRLIRVTPGEAEYWDSPGNVVSSLKFAYALATGGYPDPGEHEKVAP
jgi:general stress protein 26